jgi:hypothetical protein
MVTWCLQQLMKMTTSMSTGEGTCKFETIFQSVTSYPPTGVTSNSSFAIQMAFFTSVPFPISGCFNSLNLLNYPTELSCLFRVGYLMML